MEITEFLSRDDAVSPVIGVVLLVAITVILAALVGTLAFGAGSGATDSPPKASWSFEYDEAADPGTSSSPLVGESATADKGTLTITHDGGDNTDMGNVKLKDGEGNSADPTASGDMESTFPSEAETGDAGEVAMDDDDTLTVVYEDPDGDSTSVLAEYEN